MARPGQVLIANVFPLKPDRGADACEMFHRSPQIIMDFVRCLYMIASYLYAAIRI